MGMGKSEWRFGPDEFAFKFAAVAAMEILSAPGLSSDPTNRLDGQPFSTI
jgi:hypothetical protein